MQIRRGLLLAAIHLVVAGTLIAWQESTVWQYLRVDDAPPKLPAKIEDSDREQTVSFSPCGMWHSIPSKEILITLSEIPATALSGWRADCPGSYTLAGNLGQTWTWNNRRTEVRIAVGFWIMIGIQWLVLGSFPLIQPKRWWLEPGALITLLQMAGLICVLTVILEVLARLPAVVAAFTWLYWFGLLIWTTLRACRRLVFRRTAHAA